MSALAFPAFSLQTRRHVAGHPWLAAIFLSLVFFFANHNWNAANMWQATSQTDVNAMISRISEGSLSRQLSFMLLAAAGTLGMVMRARRPLRVDLLVLYPLVLLIAWCVLSIAWSHAPMLTAKRFVVLYAMTAAVIALVKRFSLGALVIIALTYGLMNLLLGIPAEILHYSGPLGETYRFAGTQHPNHTGVAMVLLMLASLALADWRDRRRRWFFALAVVAGGMLVLTGSRTALFAGAAAASVMTVLRWPLRRLLLVGLPVAWVVAVLGTLYTLDLVPPIWEKALLNRSDSDVRTLTGRTDIWKFSLRELSKDETRIVIGFGYDSFWTPEMARAVSKFVQFKISEGHSAYIDATLETGLVGVSLYCFCLLATLFRWCQYAWNTKAAAAAFAAAIPTMAIVHGVAESAFIDAHLWTLLLFATMAYAGLARPLSQPGSLTA